MTGKIIEKYFLGNNEKYSFLVLHSIATCHPIKCTSAFGKGSCYFVLLSLSFCEEIFSCHFLFHFAKKKKQKLLHLRNLRHEKLWRKRKLETQKQKGTKYLSQHVSKRLKSAKLDKKKQSVKFAQKQIWCWLCPRALPSPPWGGFSAAVRTPRLLRGGDSHQVFILYSLFLFLFLFTPRLLRGGDFHQVKTSRHFSIEDFYSFSHWVSSQEIWKVPATRWREWWSHRSRNGWVASKVFWEFFGQVSGLVRKSN